MGLSVKSAVRFAPREPRLAIAIDASLLLPDDSLVPISIKNISAEGFMGETPAELELGTWVGVVMPGCGIVRARVCWSEIGEVGGQFRKPLDLEQLRDEPFGEAKGHGFLQARLREGPLGSFDAGSDEE